MTRRIHFFAGLLATLTIASFFSATLFFELLGSPSTIAIAKSLYRDAGSLHFDTRHCGDGCQWFHFVEVPAGSTHCNEEEANALHRRQWVVDPCPLCDLSESMGGGGNIRHHVLSGAGIGTPGRGHQSGIDGAEHSRWLEGVRAASKVLNRFTAEPFRKEGWKCQPAEKQGTLASSGFALDR